MSLKFYYDILSQPCRAIYIFLNLNKISYHKQVINLAKGQHKTEEFKKINPLSLVPVIDDNGFILRESVGILRYLCRKNNVSDHWYPNESKAQAKVDEFIEWHHLGLRLPLTMYFQVKYLRPLLTGKAPRDSDIEKYQREMASSCDLMECVWLESNKKFLVGNHVTIADLLATMEIEQPRMAGYNPRDGRPKLTAYMDRVRSETSPYYDEACKILNSLSTK